MSTAGLIFSNLNRGSLPEMTRRRILSSVPIGCRYRLIDFPLSNMVNAGITNIGIITDYNYQSLSDHIGNGKDWDLARRSGGIRLIPPFISGDDFLPRHKNFVSQLESMFMARDFINRCPEEYLVLADCDIVCNVDFAALVEEHRAKKADITFMAYRTFLREGMLSQDNALIESDPEGRITSYVHYTPRDTGEKNILMPMMVMKTSFLRTLLDNASAHGATSFDMDILRPNLHRFRIYASYIDSFCVQINSMETYFHTSMQLLDSHIRQDLFGQNNRPIMTKVRNSAPTRYTPGSSVTNSLVGDGCVIEGTVENSIIFRGVHIGRGSVVRNCILLQDTYVGDNGSLHCVVTDKDVVIKDGRHLSGHQTMPFYIDKGAHV